MVRVNFVNFLYLNFLDYRWFASTCNVLFANVILQSYKVQKKCSDHFKKVAIFLGWGKGLKRTERKIILELDLQSHFVSFPVQKPKEVTGSFSHTRRAEPIILCPMWQAKEHLDPYWLPLVQSEPPPAGACSLCEHRKTKTKKQTA